MSDDKQKYTFIKTDKNLSSNEINKLKDFNSIKANYNKITKPINKVALYRYKNKRMFLGLVLIAIVIYLLFFYE